MEPLDVALIALGFAVGAFGTLVGAGGGFILTPILLLVFPDRKASVIAATSLLVVLANSISGTVAYARQGRVDMQSAGTFAAAGAPGAFLGTVVVGMVPRRAFDALFAVVLGSLGLYLLLRRSGTAIRAPVQGRGVVVREIRERDGARYIYAFHLWKGLAASAVIGFFSSLLGIGGGVIQVPMMTVLLHFPVHVATATSQLVLALLSGEASILNVLNGRLQWDRSLVQAGFIAIGAVPGAQAGAWAARKLHGGVILRFLAGALLLVALRLGVKAWMG